MRRGIGSCAAWAIFAAAAACAAPKPLPTFERVMNLGEPRVVADLELTDQDGKRRRLGDLAGAPVLVYFGFTHCPDACPTTLQKLALLERSAGQPLAGVRVVLVSVDGERDSPQVLKEFLGRFSGNFLGLTASPDEVRKLALSFSAPFFKDSPKNGVYAVQHSTRVYALDRQGKLRAELYDASGDATAGVVRALLAE